MCRHVFEYPEDIKENYNPDGKTLTGICRFCGAKQIAHGRRWTISLEEKIIDRKPFGIG